MIPLHHGRICSASVDVGDVTGVGKFAEGQQQTDT